MVKELTKQENLLAQNINFSFIEKYRNWLLVDKMTGQSHTSKNISYFKKILNDGGSIVLMSHLGRPKEGPTNKYSLKHD